MNRRIHVLPFCAAAVLLGMAWLYAQDPPTADSLNEGTRLQYDATNEIWRFQWWGRAGRTYFIQHTDDLQSWMYVPVIESGDDSVREWGFTTTGDKFFVRLRYTDAPTSDPFIADFDGDGVPNLFEVQNGFNPFGLVDLNSNGMADEWEQFFAGKFAIWPPNLSISIPRNQTANGTIFLRNETANPVNFSVSLANNLGPSYGFKDSVTGGIVYTWEEISTTGTKLETISNAYYGQQLVELNQFLFPYFGTNFSQIYVMPNGALSLGQPNWIYDNYYGLPSSSAPENFIAPFWDYLDTRTIGDIYYKEESDRLIVQYENVGRVGGGTNSAYTFQVVLFADGRIQFRYKAMTGTLNSATIGIQDFTRTLGLQVAYDAAYVSNQMAVEINPQSSFLSVSPVSGTVPANTTLTLSPLFRSLQLPFGTYTATITTTHDAPDVAGPHTTTASLTVLNAPATVTITSPTSGIQILQGDSLTITASAADQDGMQKVEFYNGSIMMDETSWEPYQWYWYNPSVGTHTLTARAMDIFSGSTTSAPVTVTVLADSDGDRMADDWEVSHGLNPSDPADDYADPDGDRIPNLWEYLSVTDPNDLNSKPGVTAIVAANGTADYLTLQEAFDNEPDGAVIEVRDGIYGGLSAWGGQANALAGELILPC